MELKDMSLDDLGALETAIAAERARQSGDGLLVADARGYERDIPEGGWLASDTPAVEDQASTTWYPSEEAARACMEGIAAKEGRVLRWEPGRGAELDYTVDGCRPSSVGAYPNEGRPAPYRVTVTFGAKTAAEVCRDFDTLTEACALARAYTPEEYPDANVAVFVLAEGLRLHEQHYRPEAQS